jgi:uncharacterized protein
MTFPSSSRRLACGVLFAFAIAAASPSARASTAPAADTARNETIVREAFASWAAGNGHVFGTLLAPDLVWTIHGSGPVAGTYRGREDFMQRASLPLISRLATPMVPQVHHVWAAGDTVAVRFDAAATTTGGHRYENRFVWIFRMRNGLVAEGEAFLDLAAYQRVVEENEPRPQ